VTLMPYLLIDLGRGAKWPDLCGAAILAFLLVLLTVAMAVAADDKRANRAYSTEVDHDDDLKSGTREAARPTETMPL
jgi:hypothetical protein